MSADQAEQRRAPGVPAAAGRGLARHLVAGCRPKQWLKNLLVAAAPGAAGVLFHGSVMWRTAVVFAVFCALSSGTYLLNDAADVTADRLHPTKRHRPIASGALPLRLAVGTGALLVVVGLAVSASLGWQTAGLAGSYLGVQVLYTLWLKHEPVFDLVCVSAGFVVRSIAGGTASNIPISQWFLIVTMFGSLMMVAGKRLAEYRELGTDRGAHRKALEQYSETFIRAVMYLAAGVTVTAYCLWAFEKESALHHGDGVFFQLSVVPFLLGILRYAFRAEVTSVGKPEDLVTSDLPLILVGFAWLAVFALAVYVG